MNLIVNVETDGGLLDIGTQLGQARYRASSFPERRTKTHLEPTRQLPQI
jgi:hypothetical protein